MKKTIFTVLAVSALGVSTAFAQVSFGPKIGLNVSNIHVKNEDGSLDGSAEASAKSRIGFHVGGILNAQINDYFSIRPELLYSTAGYNVKATQSFAETKGHSQWGTIILPVNFVGQVPVSDNFKVQVFAGPYVSLVTGGKYKSETTANIPFFGTQVIEYTGKVKGGKEPDNNTSNDIYINPWDLGLNFGLGFQASSFVFSASYKLGMTNLAPHSDDSNVEDARNDSDKLYNRGFNFGVAYLFGGK